MLPEASRTRHVQNSDDYADATQIDKCVDIAETNVIPRVSPYRRGVTPYPA